MVANEWVALLVGMGRQTKEKLIPVARQPLHRAVRGPVAGARSIPLEDDSVEHPALAKAVAAARQTC